ncbi:MAG: cyclic nucleotide-binding domain-containing protein [Candidatus Methylacidiphilales bacterium]
MNIPGAEQIFELADESFQVFISCLPEPLREDINARSVFRWSYAGQELIRQNTASEAVYIIEEGVVEVAVETQDSKVTHPLAYLGRGDIIGELGVINGEVRGAMVRASSDVYYRVIEAADFKDLMCRIPGFAAFIASRLARRLAQTNTNMAFNSICMDLSGKLPNFDLMGVFYTVSSSGVSGELKIVDAAKDRIGSFYFESGKPIHGRFRHLQGIEAFRQIFSEHQMEGAFSFRRSNVPSHPMDAGFILNLSLEDMMMEGAVLRDEITSMAPHWRNLEGRIVLRKAFSGNLDPSRAECARRIAAICEGSGDQGKPLREIWIRSGISLVPFARDCALLVRAGFIELLP